ncbi:endonuclease domain-containing protein [Streptomyces sp. NPDC054975]
MPARPTAAPEADVDHRHEPGRVRDVPCFNCNAANLWRDTRGSQHS